MDVAAAASCAHIVNEGARSFLRDPQVGGGTLSLLPSRTTLLDCPPLEPCFASGCTYSALQKPAQSSFFAVCTRKRQHAVHYTLQLMLGSPPVQDARAAGCAASKCCARFSGHLPYLFVLPPNNPA